MNSGANPPYVPSSVASVPAEPLPRRLTAEADGDGTDDGNLIGVTQLANVFRRHRKLILGTIGGSMALAAALMAIETPVYQATATLLLDSPLAQDGSDQPVPTAEAEMRVETETKTLASNEFAEQVVRDLDLLDHPVFTGHKATQGKTRKASEDQIDKAAAQLLTMVNVQRVPHTQLINVTVQAPEPKFAAMVANRYVEVRQKEGIRDKLRQQDQIVAALDERVRKTGEDLRKADQLVADYRRQHGMLVGAGSAEDLQTINQLAAEAASAASMRASMAAKASGVQTAAAMRPGPDSASSPLLAQQQQRYAELLQRKAELSSFYGPEYPLLANVLAQIEEVKRNMDAEKARVERNAAADAAMEAGHETNLARSDALAAAARSAVLNSYLGGATAKAYQNNAAGVRLAELERYAETQRTLYVGLAARLKQVSTALVSGPGLVMHSTAPVPTSPYSPTPAKTLMVVFLASTLLSFGVAFVLEMADRRLRSAGQIHRLFQLDTFATIPLLWSGLTKRSAGELVRKRPSSAFAESVRILLREVTDRRRGAGAQVVLVTSPLPGDGKTSVAHGLGAAAIASGLKAVLVDLDLRQPGALASRTEGAVDLQACLEKQERVQGLLEQARGDSADTSLVVIAPHEHTSDPSGLLSSSELTSFFQDLRSRVDLVIIDAPPVLALGDASLMTSLADTTLLVVRWGRTQIEEMGDSLFALKRRVDGVVLNAVDFPRHAQGRYGDFVQYFGRSSSYYQRQDGLIRPPLYSRLFHRFRARKT